MLKVIGSSRSSNLMIGEPTKIEGRFNPSHIIFDDKLIIATRVGNENARILLAEYRRNRPIWEYELKIDHPKAALGQEDPRLFVLNDVLHLSFVGIDEERHASILLADLDDSFKIANVVAPHYSNRNITEKNWIFFQHDERIYCIYEIFPLHHVLELRGLQLVDFRKMSSIKMRGWNYGCLRGGAPPVRVNNEYYHWFHGALLEPSPYYTMGLYTFEAKPPFKVCRWSPYPILHPTIAADQKPVIFPCGAYIEGNEWKIAYGYNDLEAHFASFDFDMVESRLEEI
jgi:predicted GH43/DUF377 family glycosyl hydrolase